jgi:hypothetical protein
MQIVVQPIDIETEIREIPKIIEELKAGTCNTGLVCRVGSEQQEESQRGRINGKDSLLQ